jgi:hypothetical protein
MNRIGERRARAAERPIEPAFAWWVGLAADPAVALAMVASALLLWRGEVLWRGGLALALNLTQMLGAAGRAAPALPASYHAHYVEFAFALALAPLAVWGALRLYSWGEQASAPRIEPAHRA